MSAGWKKVRLGDVCERIRLADPSKLGSRITYIDISAVDNVSFKVVSPKSIEAADAPSRARQPLRPRDVLFSTTRPSLRSVAMVPDALETPYASTGFCVLRAKLDVLDPEWLFFNCLTNEFIDSVAKLVRGANYPAVRDSDVFSQEISIPPVSVQSRIVACIREAMERVEELERLDAERRTWVAELPSAYVTEEISAARETSESRTIGEIVASVPGSMSSGPFGSQLLHSEFVPEGHLVIGIANVQEQRFDPIRKWMIDDRKLQSMQRFRVMAGDVLVTVMGTVGRAGIADGALL